MKADCSKCANHCQLTQFALPKAILKVWIVTPEQLKTYALKKETFNYSYLYKTFMKVWLSFNASFKYFKVVPHQKKNPSLQNGRTKHNRNWEISLSAHWKHTIKLSCQCRSTIAICDREYLLENSIINPYLHFTASVKYSLLFNALKSRSLTLQFNK